MGHALRLMTTGAMVAAVSSGVSAQTISDQDRADASCLLAIADRVDNPSAGEADPDDVDEQAMQILAGYFVGKIRGRSPSLPLDELITPDLLRFVQSNRAAEYDRCLDDARPIVESMGKLATMARGGSSEYD